MSTFVLQTFLIHLKLFLNQLEVRVDFFNKVNLHKNLNKHILK